jgi:DNA-binding CsgD family transcriptional regulator
MGEAAQQLRFAAGASIAAVGGDAVSFSRYREVDCEPFMSAANIDDGNVDSHDRLSFFNALAAARYVPPFDYASAPRRQRVSFLDEVELFGDPDANNFCLDYLHPMQVGHQLRALIFDGHRFVGLVAVGRRPGTAPFSRRDKAAATAMLPRLRQLLLQAERVDVAVPDDAGDVVIDDRGEVLMASAAGQAWLALPGMPRELRRLCERAPREALTPVYFAQAGAKVTVMRAGETRHLLVHLKPTVQAAVRPHLTPRQRGIASLLRDGLSLPDAADALGIGRETAKEHLRRMYLALGVRSRLELFRALEGMSLADP